MIPVGRNDQAAPFVTCSFDHAEGGRKYQIISNSLRLISEIDLYDWT